MAREGDSGQAAPREGRGRRDRRRRGNRGDHQEHSHEVAAPADALTAATPPESKPRPEAHEAAVPIERVPHAPPTPVAEPTIEPTRQPVREPRIEATDSAAAPSHPEPRPAPPARPIPELPPVALTLPPESGLELVETKFKAPPPAEPEAPAGARRVRPPKVAVADEPLQMVETSHKDAPPPVG